jgi:hypothetical protein
LSEEARKRYALLQTPEFVEEFILDRTLEPAVEIFGLKEVRLIDPTCGSGHFLLGAFYRLLKKWLCVEPGTVERELIQRALDAVYGVDVNLCRGHCTLSPAGGGGAGKRDYHVAAGARLSHPFSRGG